MNNGRHFGFPACRRDACSSGDRPCPDPAGCTVTGIETAILVCAVVVTIALIAFAFALPLGLDGMKRDLLPTPKVEIGSRGVLGVIPRCDTEKAAFEVVDSTLVDSLVEERTQRRASAATVAAAAGRIEEIRHLGSPKR
jgi:hypothetical protein